MFIVKNLRSLNRGGQFFVLCDFEVAGCDSPFEEKTMWVSISEDYAHMLTDEVYDAFVLVPIICGMYYHQDVHIEGCISPLLYHNIQNYLIKIFDNFSDFTSPIKFTVNGTKILEDKVGNIIGTGISCGVDSLTTIYDHWVMEKNPDFRINALFLFNCGTHGSYKDKKTSEVWKDRTGLNSKAAEVMGLPMYKLDTNFQNFHQQIGQQKIGYLAIYSCILALQKVIRRYYTSSCLSYDEISDYRRLSRDFDIAEFSESYMIHLLSTERLSIVVDGCQYTRSEKTERISDWHIAHQFLNVCIKPLDGGYNCSCCTKCMRTLIPLEAIGKLDKFSKVFDLNVYSKKSNRFKRYFVANQYKDSMSGSLVNYCHHHMLPMPSYIFASLLELGGRIYRKLRKINKYCHRL